MANTIIPWGRKCIAGFISHKDTRNCQEKVKKISHLKPNQLAPSIYIMKELCFFSLDQWEISIHLLWGKCFNIPHHCDPHLNQTKLNGLLPLTIPGVLARPDQLLLGLVQLGLQLGRLLHQLGHLLLGLVRPHLQEIDVFFSLKFCLKQILVLENLGRLCKLFTLVRSVHRIVFLHLRRKRSLEETIEIIFILDLNCIN